MTHRRLVVALLLVFIACKPVPQKAAPGKQAAAGGPQVRATVVNIRTTLEPSKNTFMNAVVIVDDRARSTAEHDVWRLYDVRKNTVTYVDDVAKTIRTESLDALLARNRQTMAQALPDVTAPLRFVKSGATKAIAGATAAEHVLAAGTYQRHLWLASHPRIPERLFAMMEASDPATSDLAPMMKPFRDHLPSLTGFPFADHTEVPYGNQKMVVDRVVVSVEEKNVAESLLTIPKNYKDVTPKATTPPARPRPSS